MHIYPIFSCIIDFLYSSIFIEEKKYLRYYENYRYYYYANYNPTFFDYEIIGKKYVLKKDREKLKEYDLVENLIKFSMSRISFFFSIFPHS